MARGRDGTRVARSYGEMRFNFDRIERTNKPPLHNLHTLPCARWREPCAIEASIRAYLLCDSELNTPIARASLGRIVPGDRAIWPLTGSGE